MLIRFEGLVLRKKDYGESNQIITVFTEQHGRISLVARGSKKTRSRFGAVTEPFTVAQFICFQRFKGSMPTLSQADVIFSHQEIRSDLVQSAYGAYWFDLFLRSCNEKEPYPTIYRMMKKGLEWLAKGKDADILTRMVELRIMEAAGYQPLLTQCVCCHQKHRPFRFSVKQGGVLCESCFATNPDAVPMTERAHRVLYLLQRIDMDRLGEIQIREETKLELERILQRFLRFYLDTDLTSWRILNQLKS